MKKITAFFNKFLEEEYQLRLKYFDTDIIAEDYDQSQHEFGKYFHPVMNNYATRFYSRNKIFYLRPERFLKEKDYLLKRVLFQIKKYKSPVFGELLDQKVKTKTIYRGYFGPARQTTSPDLRFSRAFFAYKEDKTYKIIYNERFTLGKWERPHDHQPAYIQDFGQLVKTKKIQAPEEEASLKDYNQE